MDAIREFFCDSPELTKRVEAPDEELIALVKKAVPVAMKAIQEFNVILESQKEDKLAVQVWKKNVADAHKKLAILQSKVDGVVDVSKTPRRVEIELKEKNDKAVKCLVETRLRGKIEEVSETVNHTKNLSRDLDVLRKASDDLINQIKDLTKRATETKLTREIVLELFTLYEELTGIHPFTGDIVFKAKVDALITHMKKNLAIDLQVDIEFQRTISGVPIQKNATSGLQSRAVELWELLGQHLCLLEEKLKKFEPEILREELLEGLHFYDKEGEATFCSQLLITLNEAYTTLNKERVSLKVSGEDIYKKHHETLPMEACVMCSTVLTNFGKPVSRVYGMNGYTNTKYVMSPFN